MAAVIPPNQGKPNANSDLGGIPHITVPPAHFFTPAKGRRRKVLTTTHGLRDSSPEIA